MGTSYSYYLDSVLFLELCSDARIPIVDHKFEYEVLNFAFENMRIKT